MSAGLHLRAASTQAKPAAGSEPRGSQLEFADLLVKSGRYDAALDIYLKLVEAPEGHDAALRTVTRLAVTKGDAGLVKRLLPRLPRLAIAEILPAVRVLVGAGDLAAVSSFLGSDDMAAIIVREGHSSPFAADLIRIAQPLVRSTKDRGAVARLLRVILALDPGNSAAAMSLTRLFKADLDSAAQLSGKDKIALLEGILRDDPLNASAIKLLAQAIAESNPAQARSLLLRLDPAVLGEPRTLPLFLQASAAAADHLQHVSDLLLVLQKCPEVKDTAIVRTAQASLRRALQDKDYRAVILLTNLILKVTPNDPSAHRLQTSAQGAIIRQLRLSLRGEDKSDVIPLWDTVGSGLKDDVLLRQLLRHFMADRDLARAADVAGQLLKVNSQDLGAHAALAQIHHGSGAYEDAVRHASAVLEQDPENKGMLRIQKYATQRAGL